MAFLQSKCTRYYLSVLSPTLNLQAGEIRNLPLLYINSEKDNIFCTRLCYHQQIRLGRPRNFLGFPAQRASIHRHLHLHGEPRLQDREAFRGDGRTYQHLPCCPKARQSGMAHGAIQDEVGVQVHAAA